MSRLGQHRLDIYAEKVLAGDPAVVAPAGAGGILVKEQYFVDGAFASIDNNQIPFDNSIPTDSEGAQVMISAAYVPLAAVNILTIEVNVAFSNEDTGCCCALFEDGIAAAIATWPGVPVVSNAVLAGLAFKHRVVAGSLASRQYAVRLGTSSAVTPLDFNGRSSGPIWGGTLVSSILIRETTP